jgi:IS605 OrfB family transposase
MQLVEKHIITKYHPFYNECDKICLLSKNLYNKANYIVRQEFINTSKEKQEGLRDYAVYLDYQQIRRILIKDETYCALPRKVSNQTLMLLDKNWKSFFVAIKDYTKNKHKYNGKPKLPYYKHILNGRFTATYELGAISKKDLKNGYVGLSGTSIKIPTTKTNIKQCRIVPRNKHFIIEIVYELIEKETKENNHRFAAIDLGVNNLATITINDKGLDPLIINGKPLKSINQYYNKKKGEYQSKLNRGGKEYGSNRIINLTNKRNNKVNDYLHKSSRYIINHLVSNNINTLVIGKNDNWKQEINIGDISNQNFVNIPHSTFIRMLDYKCKLEGIRVILTEESYTSRASFLHLDYIPTYGKNDNNIRFSGYRYRRGLYKIRGNKVFINADVNGSYNIMRKAISRVFDDGIEGLSVNPVVSTPRR